MSPMTARLVVDPYRLVFTEQIENPLLHPQVERRVPEATHRQGIL
jgi:hypothetical protein